MADEIKPVEISPVVIVEEPSPDAGKNTAAVDAVKALMNKELVDVFDKDPHFAVLAQILIELKK